MEIQQTIFAVLADLEAYAEQNSLPELRDTIRSTRALAVVEISGLDKDTVPIKPTVETPVLLQ